MPRITLVIDDPALPMDVHAFAHTAQVARPDWDVLVVQPRPGAGPTVIVKMRTADGDVVISSTSARLWCQVAAEIKDRYPVIGLEEQRPTETVFDREGRL